METVNHTNPDGTVVGVWLGDGVWLGNYVWLGNNVKLRNGVTLRDNVKLGDGVWLGDYVKLGNDVTLGDGVMLGNDVTLGDGVWLGNYVTLRDNVTLGVGVWLGNNVKLLSFTKIPDGINGLTFQMGFYPCTVCGEYITSGCHVKTVDEWLDYLTPGQARMERMPDWAYPYYRKWFEWVKQLMEG